VWGRQLINSQHYYASKILRVTQARGLRRGNSIMRN